MPDNRQRKAAKKKIANEPAPTGGILMHSPLRTPPPWAFRLFVAENGRNDFIDWDARLSQAARARRASTMKFLRVQPEARWSRPHASPIRNNSYVIRFHDETGAQLRLFGFFSLEHHAFVICVIGREVGDKYYPKDYEERIARCKAVAQPAFHERTVDCPWPMA